MGNCLEVKLKGAVNNDNLEILGFTSLFVDTRNLGSELTVYFFNTSTGSLDVPVGAYLLDNKTFSNGKNKVEQGDSTVAFSIGDTYTILYPYYDNIIPIFNNPSDVSVGYSNIVLKDFDKIQFAATDNSWNGTTMNIAASNGDTIKPKGNVEYYMNLNGDALENFIMLGSNAALDITSNVMKKYKALKTFIVTDCPNVKGKLETFISNLCQANKEAMKARTNTLDLRISGSAITSDTIWSGAINNTILTFNGTSTVSITNGVTYDIDTDTFSGQ